MATSDYGATYYPNPTGVAANVPVEVGKTAESLEGRTVMSFATVGDRDTAFATLTTAQKKGVVCHVEGKGLWTSTGTVWKPVASGLQVRCAVQFTSVNGTNTTDANGEGICTWADNQNGVLVASPFPNGCHSAAVSDFDIFLDEPILVKVLSVTASTLSFRIYRHTGARFPNLLLPLTFTGTGY